jgi:UTP--glucose-1-phosphate uridylyltransferase
MTTSGAINKVVIPAAGSGSRLLPVTQSLPKEMLPVGRRVTIHHVAQEALAAGVVNVLIVTASHKRAIEEHFDWVLADQPARLPTGNSAGSKFCFALQSQPLGLANAVGLSQPWVGQEDFLCSLGDTIIWSREEEPLIHRMIRAHREHGAAATIAVEEVDVSQVHRYGIVRPADGDAEVFTITDLVEKPSAEKAPSRLAIAARYIFHPEIFDAIAATEPGEAGELQLTDSIRLLAAEGRPLIGVRLRPGERRYDIGNFTSYYQAYFDYAWNDPDAGPEFRAHVEQSLKEDAGS